MANVNNTMVYGNTFIDLCDEAARSYREPYRVVDPCYHHEHQPHHHCFVGPILFSNHQHNCNGCSHFHDPNHKCPGNGDDGYGYSSNCPCSCHDDPGLGEINRDDIPNIINIETKLMLTLKIILYSALGSEYDTELVLETGKLYKVKYLTDCGIQTITGVLMEISTNIPMVATRYIGEANESLQYCYINMDCSTVGKSDKRMIFINSIRAIEEVVEEESPDTEEETP